mmetsp:Transcript_14676/g.24995  ORF Transcript_14676/g.24995 Transcript_14676/m.24995 type:complete len:81 (+) Transcript_14676:135-377(+)
MRQYNKYSLKSESEQSWAVVTGGSDGLGFQFCRKLASQKFNICIVSRNGSKIEGKLEELRREFGTENPHFKTMGIVADLS